MKMPTKIPVYFLMLAGILPLISGVWIACFESAPSFQLSRTLQALSFFPYPVVFSSADYKSEISFQLELRDGTSTTFTLERLMPLVYREPHLHGGVVFWHFFRMSHRFGKEIVAAGLENLVCKNGSGLGIYPVKGSVRKVHFRNVGALPTVELLHACGEQ